jgi:hypothetical protein
MQRSEQNDTITNTHECQKADIQASATVHRVGITKEVTSNRPNVPSVRFGPSSDQREARWITTPGTHKERVGAV